MAELALTVAPLIIHTISIVYYYCLFILALLLLLTLSIYIQDL